MYRRVRLGLDLVNDELGIIFNSFSDFQYSLQKYIHTVTKRVDTIEAYILVGTTMMTSFPEQLILERKIKELEMYCIADRLHIDGLDACINAGTGELQVGEVIICYPQEPKAHMVATNC